MRAFVLATFVLSGTALAEAPAPYVPAPANEIPGYSASLFPCTTVRGWKTFAGGITRVDKRHPADSNTSTFVECRQEPHLENKSLRELALLRNTIFARYGWAGFRKPWLREHFQKQPWYKPDPNFSYSRLTDTDRKNVALIAQAELSLRYVDLEGMRDTLLAKAGKWWGDLPVDPKDTASDLCVMDSDAASSKDCRYHRDEEQALKKHRANKPVAPDLASLSAEDRIELGLISRAMGDFALDEGQREQAAGSLDAVLSVKDLRQLSLRDLRLLRNTIYARRGRPFKSPMLQEHFAHMPWYKADPTYTDARLTATDKRNVDLIRSVEEEFGGALKDSDFKVGKPSQAQDIPPEVAA